MAKDGTMRGGQRVGAGKKRKKFPENQLEYRSTGIKDFDFADLSGSGMPEPKEYLLSVQRDRRSTYAEQIYSETWEWLKANGCENLVNPHIIENYAQMSARYIQCEEVITEYGFLAKHPTTGAAITSPYVRMSLEYMKQVNTLWFQIYQVVRDNFSEKDMVNNPQSLLMERLLLSRRQKR